MTELSTVGVYKRIRELIAGKNHTCASFAREVGVGQETVTQILAGESKPSLATLIKIANTQCVSLDWLCSEE